jgi:tetratricopeptide (TPR) repeat protein
MERVDATTPPALEARLLSAYSSFVAPARLQSEQPFLERAAQLYRTLGDSRGLFSTLLRWSTRRPLADAERGLAEAASLMDHSWPPEAQRALLSARAATLMGAKRLDECWEVRQQLVRLDKSIGDPPLIINSLANLADLAFARDDIEAAIRIGREALDHLRREWPRMRDEPNFVVANLGSILIRAGQLDEALQLSREGCRQMRASGVFVFFLEHYALLAFKSGRIADSARTAGHVVAFHRRMNIRPMLNEERALAEVIDALRQAVPNDELERLFREGEALSAEEAARIALDEQPETCPDFKESRSY